MVDFEFICEDGFSFYIPPRDIWTTEEFYEVMDSEIEKAPDPDLIVFKELYYD